MAISMLLRLTIIIDLTQLQQHLFNINKPIHI